MYLLNQFWSPRKLYEPCGMFTNGHIQLLLLSMFILSILLFKSKKITDSQIIKVTKVFAVLISALEVIKIYFNFHYTIIATYERVKLVIMKVGRG